MRGRQGNEDGGRRQGEKGAVEADGCVSRVDSGFQNNSGNGGVDALVRKLAGMLKTKENFLPSLTLLFLFDFSNKWICS